MTLTFTILGCGSSAGVPRVGGKWGACDPTNPKNRRLRCSALVERKSSDGVTRVLVDTSPDCRTQLLSQGVDWLDGVLFTHEHADHCHGIDELRQVSFNGRSKVDVYHDARIGEKLHQRFAYCFRKPSDSNYQQILNSHVITPGESISIDGPGGAIEVMPFRQYHGNTETMGFRFGRVGYSPDVKMLPEESLALLQGLDLWVVDALRYQGHPCHFSVEEALEMIAQLKPKHAVLTHMHEDLDYAELSNKLPEGVEPAYDGLSFEVDD